MFTKATMHISTGTHAQLPQALCTNLEQYKLFHSHHMHPVADTFYLLFLVHIHTRLNCVLWRLAASKQHHKIVKTACLFYSFSQLQRALKVQLQGVRLSQTVMATRGVLKNGMWSQNHKLFALLWQASVCSCMHMFVCGIKHALEH